MTSQLSQLPSWFTSSIRDLGSYPENLVHKSTYPGALKSYKTRLDEIEKKLFVTRDEDVNVPFRDLIGTGPAFDKHKVHDHEELQVRLGDASRMYPNAAAIQQDTRCRFIFLYGDHSISPLKITRKMLVRILSYYQVMPSYLEFLLVFGIHRHSREKRFSAFRSECLLGGQNPALEILGRSGNQFQVCYNLKAVARWTEPGRLVPTDSHWSIRQGAVHHQFDVWKGNSLWIIARAGLDIKERIESMTGRAGRSEDREFQTPEQCLKSSLAVHLLLCHWSSENWRIYFQWLEDTVESETFGVVHGPRAHDEPRQTSSSFHLQKAQNLEEQTTEAIMVLKGNNNVLLSLRDFYQRLRENELFPLKDTCGPDLSAFATQVDSFIYDSNMQIERGRLLADNIAARRTMILQHLQSQATEKMETLTTRMQKDSLTVRVIAFLTFLYLPATFVSTFFSTDVIKYQGQSSGNGGNEASPGTPSGSFSSIALYRWLQVTLPLTFLTFAAAIFWLRREGRRLKKANHELPMTEVKT